MDARKIWDKMDDVERLEAINTRQPVHGVVFRCIISGKTKNPFIEAKNGDSWDCITLPPKTWNLSLITPPPNDP